jgi:hypothetical protein
VPKLHNIIVYNSAINNIITLKPIKFQVTSVLSVSSVRFRYLPRYFGSSKLGTEYFGSVLGSRYFVPTPTHRSWSNPPLLLVVGQGATGNEGWRGRRRVLAANAVSRKPSRPPAGTDSRAPLPALRAAWSGVSLARRSGQSSSSPPPPRATSTFVGGGLD